MIAKEYLNSELIPLKPTDSGELAIQQMEANRVLHYPIVHQKKFQGLLSEKDIVGSKDPDGPINKMTLSRPDLFAKPCQHILDVLSLAVECQLTLVPVVNDDKEYLGALTLSGLRQAVGDITASDSPGSIIVIEMTQNDYYLSEITRLVEAENARILSLFLKSFPDSTRLEVNLKINKLNPERILMSLRRYDYQIKAYWAESFPEKDKLQDRYESLMKYLDI